MFERLAKLNSIVIPHTAFANAQGQIERSLVSTADENGYIAVLGEYGTGKTCLLRNFLSIHAPVEGARGTKIPALFVSAPPNATITTVTQRMLIALGEPSVGRSTMAGSAHLVRAMRSAGSQLIVLDDCQNLGDSRTERKTRDLCEWLIDLTCHTETRLILAGPPSCSDLIAQNRRFVRVSERRPFWNVSPGMAMINAGSLWPYSNHLNMSLVSASRCPFSTRLKPPSASILLRGA
ncbi:MAG: ATP-binding protein [Acidobacteria bacterium]|nr:ATP-binding protein [Acidobacteriota bacterium]